MPRTARLRIADVPLHVVQRGHDKCPCFITERGFELYLGLVAEWAPIARCDIHAYVLMPNHVHFLLTGQDEDACTAFMRAVNQRYSQWFNRTMQRIGTLWQGRFWSSPVDTSSYFFACQRYIELNPVRAGLVDGAQRYPWSSYRANAGAEASLVVTPHRMYTELGNDGDARRSAYREFFREELDVSQLQAIRNAIRSGLPLGSDAFIDQLERTTGRRLRPGRPGRRGVQASGLAPASGFEE